MQKEKEEGKPNLVLLHMKENPNVGVEQSIEVIQKILDEKKREFLEQVLVSGMSDMTEECKLLHFHCLKVFQMFFNSINAFDSPTELLADINKAIYDPLEIDHKILASSYSQGGTKSLQVQPRVTGTSSRTCMSIMESGSSTAGAVKFLRAKEFSEKPHSRFLSLKMRKPVTCATFPMLKACAYLCHK